MYRLMCSALLCATFAASALAADPPKVKPIPKAHCWLMVCTRN